MKKEIKHTQRTGIHEGYEPDVKAAVRTEHKDRLFNFIFGREENKAWTLSLFNAVNGSSYDDPSQIEFNTLEGFLYMGMRNDTSFLIAELMNLYEHQSTFNPNMPLRMLEYIGKLYSGYVSVSGANKYGSTLIQLPVPKLLVFYNGETEVDDEIILRLSDSFDPARRAEADVEVRVRMLNINYGRNRKLMDACKPLAEYSWFIERIREVSEELKHLSEENWEKKARKILSKAVDRAIDEMPEDFMIQRYMLKHRAEILGMLDTELDLEEVERLFKADIRREAQRADAAEARAYVEKTRADTAETQAYAEKARADAAEAKAYVEKTRADTAEAQIRELRAEMMRLKKRMGKR